MQKSKVYQLSDEQFKDLVANSSSYSDCLRKLGLTPKGGSSLDILKARIYELNCSTKHFTQAKNSNYHHHSLDTILVKHSKYANIASLKRRILKAGLLEYKCSVCGLTEWRGMPISLQLDHINGEHDDHRLENLRLLCPNCHAQTETFAGKNKLK
jgi:hypothetical protein